MLNVYNPIKKEKVFERSAHNIKIFYKTKCVLLYSCFCNEYKYFSNIIIYIQRLIYLDIYSLCSL